MQVLPGWYPVCPILHAGLSLYHILHIFASVLVCCESFSPSQLVFWKTCFACISTLSFILQLVSEVIATPEELASPLCSAGRIQSLT